MSFENLTPWFPSTVTPVREGVYLRCRDSAVLGSCFAHWNGSYWGILSTTKQAAKTHANLRTGLPDEEWRGLAEEPKND